MKLDYPLTKARILVADAHPLILEEVSRFLERNYKIVGVVQDGDVLVSAAKKCSPDVVLLDINMPGLDGIEAARQTQAACPNLKVIFISNRASPIHVIEALEANVSGYFLKDCESAEVASAIKTILAGQKYISPRVAHDALRSLMNTHSADKRVYLTSRQREVLQLLARGSALKEIAHVLHLSVKTVEFHKSELCRRVGLRTTAELTRFAVTQGLATLETYRS